MNDEKVLKILLNEAKLATDHDDVPVAAAVVFDSEIISLRHNERELLNDSTAHAEVLAIRDASIGQGVWNLTGATIYCTLEPCLMCVGAIINSRISRVVYAASDPQVGAISSIFKIDDLNGVNHKFEVNSGLYASEASNLIKSFFKDLRK